MLILSMLSGGEQYAYELSKTLKRISQGFFDIQGPSLYTALYRMEQKDFLATREQPIGGRIRVYYRLLPAGEEYLKRLIAEYHSVSKGIQLVLAATVQPESSEDA